METCVYHFKVYRPSTIAGRSRLVYRRAATGRPDDILAFELSNISMYLERCRSTWVLYDLVPVIGYLGWFVTYFMPVVCALDLRTCILLRIRCCPWARVELLGCRRVWALRASVAQRPQERELDRAHCQRTEVRAIAGLANYALNP